jgi:DNA polymerase III sliding clamp (beta) subunit (PCNA family)
MSPDIGEASEDVEDTDAAAALSIGFNSTLLLDALAILAADREVALL